MAALDQDYVMTVQVAGRFLCFGDGFLSIQVLPNSKSFLSKRIGRKQRVIATDTKIYPNSTSFTERRSITTIETRYHNSLSRLSHITQSLIMDYHLISTSLNTLSTPQYCHKRADTRLTHSAFLPIHASSRHVFSLARKVS